MKSKKLNHIAAGLLGSFVSRNNDVGGYWALGMMYREAARQGNSVALDLLDPESLASSSAASAARHYAHFLRDALQKHAMAPDALMQARIAIQFDATTPVDVPGPGMGDIFACTVTLADRQGGMAQRTVVGRCKPYIGGAFSQSTRVPANAC